MMKKLLFSLLAVLTTTGAFAHEEGDYVFTGSQRFKVDTGNMLVNGDFSDGTNEWTDKELNPVTAEGWSTLQAGGPNGENALQSQGGDVSGALCRTIQVTPGTTYALSFYIKGDAAGSADNTFAFINMDGTLEKGTNSIDAPVVDVMSTATYKDEWKEVTAVFTPNDSLSGKNGTPTLVISFGPLATNVTLASFSLNEVHEVYDTRIAQLKIDYARMLMADANFTGDPSNLQGTIASIEEYMPTEVFDSMDDAAAFVTQLDEDIAAFLDANTLNLVTLMPGLDIASQATYGRGGIGNRAATYKLNLVGNWGHLDSEPDALRSAIQNSYDHTATYTVYHEDLPAGKYFFTGEIRCASTDKTSWPCNIYYDAESNCTIFVGENTQETGIISGEQYKRFYMVAEIAQDGQFKAGFDWPGIGKKGGAFFLRNTEVRAFNTGVLSEVEHIQAFKKYIVQWNAATNARRGLISMQSANNENYPWDQQVLTDARDKYDYYYKTQYGKQWSDEDGEDTGKASTEELNDWTLYQGIEEYSEPDGEGNTKRLEYQLVRGYQNAANKVKATNKPFTDLAEAIDAAKKERNKGANATGDRDAFKAAIEKAIETITNVRKNTTDATRVADSTTLANALEELNAANEAFLASISSAPVVDIDFTDAAFAAQDDGSYVIAGKAGQMVFSGGVVTDPSDMDNAACLWDLGYNGEYKDVLRVGSQAAYIPIDGVTDDDAVRITFDLWLGYLNKTGTTIELQNAEGASIAKIFRHNGGDSESTFGLTKDQVNKMTTRGNSSTSNAAIMVDANKTSLDLNIDYQAGIMYAIIVNGANGTIEGEKVAITELEDNKVAKLVISSGYSSQKAPARRSWMDNVKIWKATAHADFAEDITESAWGTVNETPDYDENADGIRNIVSEQYAGAIYTISGVQVKSTSKPGLYILNGKKFVVK